MTVSWMSEDRFTAFFYSHYSRCKLTVFSSFFFVFIIRFVSYLRSSSSSFCISSLFFSTPLSDFRSCFFFLHFVSILHLIWLLLYYFYIFSFITRFVSYPRPYSSSLYSSSPPFFSTPLSDIRSCSSLLFSFFSIYGCCCIISSSPFLLLGSFLTGVLILLHSIPSHLPSFLLLTLTFVFVIFPFIFILQHIWWLHC